MADLSIEFAGLTFKNPVMVASGTFGYSQEMANLVDLNRLGAVVTKTITLEPRSGIAPPRIVETQAGMLNSIGLANVGIQAFINDKIPFLRGLDTQIIVNVAGKTQDEFIRVIASLEEVDGIDAYELNYSCPNVKQGGLAFSADVHLAQIVTQAIRKISKRPIIAKLTPNVTSIVDIGLAVESAGADAVSAINTLVGMAIDLDTRKPKLSTVTGGFSGPAIKPVALAMVYQLCQSLSIPVIGIGGIMNTQDALEFLTVGAKAIQVGTANFIQPDITEKIIQGLEDYCVQKEIDSIDQIIDSLEV
jgi:dihydroorotate dehydrogenase (NAD+) catalytic subunit